MPITIEMMDGEGAGQKLAFDDNIETIVIGRDPERCQVATAEGYAYGAHL